MKMFGAFLVLCLFVAGPVAAETNFGCDLPQVAGYWTTKQVSTPVNTVVEAVAADNNRLGVVIRRQNGSASVYLGNDETALDQNTGFGIGPADGTCLVTNAAVYLFTNISSSQKVFVIELFAEAPPAE